MALMQEVDHDAADGHLSADIEKDRHGTEQGPARGEGSERAA
jgi:hypothetical protein